MHILVVNDDGPPSVHSSPYVHSLVRELQSAGHTVSVCLPHTQRSWIGKAHLIGQTVKPTYYRPPPPSAKPAGLVFGDEPESEGSTHARPSATPGVEEWVLVNGTPASCVQIGLHHLFADRGPIDLVLSGPNYGRNTTALFALSSGTLGGALEAAACRMRAVALSYAFFSRNHDPVIVAAASRHAVRVVEALVRQWPADGSVDLYSVNVPLVERVDSARALWTPMLQNYWAGGGCFTAVDEPELGEDEDEERIREGSGGEALAAAAPGLVGGPAPSAASTSDTARVHKHFKWQPRFAEVYRSVEEAPPGNDGWAVQQGHTSVTPLKTNFWQAATHLHGQDLQLSSPESQAMTTTTLPIRLKSSGSATAQTAPRPDHLYALIAYGDPYVQPLILDGLRALLPDDAYTLLKPPAPPEGRAAAGDEPMSLAGLVPAGARALQIAPYEAIDFDYAEAHGGTTVVNSYKFRKALIRKHFLAATVEKWLVAHPDSALAAHVKPSCAFEVDYAEFLDDALVEAWELRASLDGPRREWWILKPSMSDRGQGIRLFSSMEELQAIFDEWEVDDTDDEDEDEDENEGQGGVVAAHLRHFVAQPYIDPPLLLPGDGRKFHIRTYVVCVGALRVYVYREMLALFAATPYRPPSAAAEDLGAHLTNTCLQQQQQPGQTQPAPLVRRFWDLPDELGAADGATTTTTATATATSKDTIFAQICRATGAVFEAAARGMPMHMSPLAHAFEIYGLDFLVDAGGTAWLLEVNAFPDFRQTGADLRDVVAGLWRDTLHLAVVDPAARPPPSMVLVADLDLARDRLPGSSGWASAG